MCQPFKVICLDDKNRPDGIPTSKWVKKGEPYTVIQVTKLDLQNGLLGFKLAELNIDDCLPYQYFAATRFGVPVSEKKLEEVAEEIETVCQ
jgi:hypothetical protein